MLTMLLALAMILSLATCGGEGLNLLCVAVGVLACAAFLALGGPWDHGLDHPPVAEA